MLGQRAAPCSPVRRYHKGTRRGPDYTLPAQGTKARLDESDEFSANRRRTPSGVGIYCNSPVWRHAWPLPAATPFASWNPIATWHSGPMQILAVMCGGVKRRQEFSKPHPWTMQGRPLRSRTLSWCAMLRRQGSFAPYETVGSLWVATGVMELASCVGLALEFDAAEACTTAGVLFCKEQVNRIAGGCLLS